MNRNTASAALGCLALLLTAGTLGAESFYVAVVTDTRKSPSFDVVDQQALNRLRQQTRAEERVFSAALAAARKAWEENELHKGVPFPAAGLRPRTLREIGPFPSVEAARKKADAMAQRALDAEFDRSAPTKKSGRKLSDREKEKEAERAAREREQEANIAAAAELLQEQIDALLRKGAATSSARPPATAAPAAA